jgi:hypothetical protein
MLPVLVFLSLIAASYFVMMVDAYASKAELQRVRRYNNWLPRLLLFLSKATIMTRKGVTLPSFNPLQPAVVIRYSHSEDEISDAHDLHEDIGHGGQIEDMGGVDYTATYVWHYILGRGDWKDSMQERDADKRVREFLASAS